MDMKPRLILRRQLTRLDSQDVAEAKSRYSAALAVVQEIETVHVLAKTKVWNDPSMPSAMKELFRARDHLFRVAGISSELYLPKQ